MKSVQTFGSPFLNKKLNKLTNLKQLYLDFYTIDNCDYSLILFVRVLWFLILKIKHVKRSFILSHK